MLFIKIKETVSRDTVQRILNSIAFVCWIALILYFVLPDRNVFPYSRFRLEDLILFIPAAILLVQVMINAKWLWAIIFGLFTFQLLYEIIELIRDLIYYRYNLLELAVYCLTCICIDVIIFYMKPQY